MNPFILALIAAAVNLAKTVGIVNPKAGQIVTDADVLLQIVITANAEYKRVTGEPVDWTKLHEIEPIP